MSLLQMSFTGGVLIAVIAILRAVTLSRLPKKAFLVLWAVALVRLLVPFSLPSVFSVYTYVEPESAIQQIQPVQRPIQPIQPVQAIPAAPTPAPAQSPAPKPEFPVKTAVWVAGAGLCFLYFTVSYWRCRREFMTALPVEDGSALGWLSGHGLRRRVALRQSDRISAPLTYGVIHPVILMPKNTNWTNWNVLQYVLSHELVHIRRFDALTKLVLTGALCIHWFNPLVWVMYILANRDLELSCDEEVVRQFGINARSAYALTLIGMEEQKSGLSGLYSYFNKNAMEERITAIMKTKKLTIPAVCAALALVIGITAAFATSAMPVAEELRSLPGFTQEENDILQSIWADGYEDLTIAEYRDKMLQMRDDPAVEALFQRLDKWLKTEEANEVRRNSQNLDEFLQSYTELYKPLMYGDAYTYSGAFYEAVSVDQQEPKMLGMLEYEYQLDVIKPEILTVRNYNDARLDIFDALSRTWDGSEQMEPVQEVCEQLTIKWSDENLAVFVTAVYRLADGDSLDHAALDASSDQEWDKLLAPYLPFGLSFEFDPNAAQNGFGLRMTWQGREVRGIVDGESWIAETAGITRYGPDAVELYAVRDADGKLTGLRLPTDAEQAEWTALRTKNSEQLDKQNSADDDPRKTAPGTKADYDSLFSAAKITEYKQLTLDKFNQLLLDWGNEHFDAYESILEDTRLSRLPGDLSVTYVELEFLQLSMPLSVEENYCMIQSLNTGKPEETPCFTAGPWDRTDGKGSWCSLWCQFPYHVADKSTMTVKERDRRISGLEQDVHQFFTNTDFDQLVKMSENDIVVQIQEIAKRYSDKAMTITVDSDYLQYETMDAPPLSAPGQPSSIPQEVLDLLVDGKYPVNSKGHTYGPDILYEVTGEMPDLTAATGDDDIEGYIREQDLLDEFGPAPDVLYLYDKEENIIGTFTMANGEPMEEELPGMIPARGRMTGDLSPEVSGYIRREDLQKALAEGIGAFEMYDEQGRHAGMFLMRDDWTWNYNEAGELLSSIATYYPYWER